MRNAAKKETSIKMSLIGIAKSVLGFGALFALLFSLLLVTGQAKASTLSDLQKKQQELSKQINQNSKTAAQKKKEAEELQKNLNQINAEIAKIQAKIAETEGKISETEQEISDLSDQIRKKEEEIAWQKGNQAEALRSIYEQSQVDNWEIILGSNNLSEIINRGEYLEALEQKIEAAIAQIRLLKSQMEEKKAEAEKKKKELDELKSQQEAYQQGLSYQKDQKNRLYKDTKSQQKALEAQVAEAKKLSSEVEAAINRIMASINAGGRKVIARDRGTSSVGLQWPMDYMYISAYWGEPTPFQASHTGIDLVNVSGSPIYASASGTVTAIESMQTGGHYYGYGNYIVIGHNARFSTLYAHLMSFSVSLGQEVSQGQIIGYEGTTGWSTGPHLHFEVWEYGGRYNPMNYLP